MPRAVGSGRSSEADGLAGATKGFSTSNVNERAAPILYAPNSVRWEMQQKRTKGKGEERRGERRTGERREDRGEESEVARLQRPFGGCFPATLAPGNSDIAGMA